jgi:hypothetical protein
VQTEEQRPTYRHIVVLRKGFVEKVASKAQLQLLRGCLDMGMPIPPELAHLVKGSFSREQVEQTFGADRIEWSTAPDAIDVTRLADEINLRLHQGVTEPIKVRPPTSGGAVVVGRLTQVHIPGGNERLPTLPTSLSHPGVQDADDPMMAFKRCADALVLNFRAYSDRQFQLADPWTRQNCTLVTVVYTPIIAAPRKDTGFELFCEFTQVTRIGHVDALADGFEVVSETGDFPVRPPRAIELAMMMRSVDELRPVAHDEG